MARLLEGLDDRDFLETVFSRDLMAGRDLDDWQAAHFRSAFVPWWVRTRAPLDALKCPDRSSRDDVLSALGPAELFFVFSAGEEEARGAAGILLMKDGYENSSYARRIGEWAIEQLGHKETLDWNEHPGHPDEDIDLLMMCCPDRLIEQVETLAGEQPEQRTWLLDALLLFARQNGHWASQARVLARRLALQIGTVDSKE